MIVASMIVDEGIHTKQLQVKFFKKSKNVFAEKRRRHRDSPKKNFLRRSMVSAKFGG
jgi:hypothetical protein